MSTTVLAQESAPTAAAGPDSANPAFDVWEYRVLGNSLLDARTIESAVYPHLGPGRSLEDVQQARASLEQAFRSQGYGTVYVDIPEQDTADGIVRLQVTEGKLDRVRITGARYFSNGRIRERLTALQSGQVPSLPQIQKQLAVINAENPDRGVTPVLRAGRTPGTVDVELRVTDKLPLHGSVEVNDRYSADTSETRVAANLTYGNLFQRNHSLSLQYQVAPENVDESTVMAATYVAPLTPSDILAVYAVNTSSDVAAVGTLSVLGNGRIYGARYIRVLPADEGSYQNLALGFDYKDFAESIRLDADGEAIDTPIAYGAWSLVYSGGGSSEAWRRGYSLGAYFGLRSVFNDPIEFGGNPADPTDPRGKRFKAKPNYFYLRGSGSLERSLPAGSSLAAKLAGQFTTAPLISNEQFGIGGFDSVRGYLESEQLGDIGVSGSVELRSPSLSRWLGEHVKNAQFFLFYDAGLVSLVDPLEEQTSRFDLASAGAGFRFRGFGGLEAALDWAYPLVASTRIAEGDSRIHFAVKYGF